MPKIHFGSVNTQPVHIFLWIQRRNERNGEEMMRCSFHSHVLRAFAEIEYTFFTASAIIYDKRIFFRNEKIEVDL